jgi:two-component sensor histidine kinase
MSVHAISEASCRDLAPERLRPRMSILADHGSSDADFRQLRHLTKNTMQRILLLISQNPGLRSTPAGRALSQDLQQCIVTAADLSDALFGFVEPSSSLGGRLLNVSNRLVQLLGEDAATIRLVLSVQGHGFGRYDDTLVRIAHELVGNAVKHGMHQRLRGDIRIQVEEEPEHIALIVTDDGWGPPQGSANGEGLSIVDALLRPLNGRCQLRRVGLFTVARAVIAVEPGTVAASQPVSRQHPEAGRWQHD